MLRPFQQYFSRIRTMGELYMCVMETRLRYSKLGQACQAMYMCIPLSSSRTGSILSYIICISMKSVKVVISGKYKNLNKITKI